MLKKRLFILGMILFVVSFALPAVAMQGDKAIRGYVCAYLGLILPVVTWNQGSIPNFLLLLAAGWINPLFLVWLVWRNIQAAQWLRFVIAAMIPLSWMTLWHMKMTPHIGHFIWIAGLLLAITSFSREDDYV